MDELVRTCVKFCVFVLQGHTVFDLADKDMLKVLEELKKKQVTVSDHILTITCEWHLRGNIYIIDRML